LVVDHRVLSIEDNKLRTVEVPRADASDLQVQQFSSTAVHANTLAPSRSYRITIEGVRGNGIYLSSPAGNGSGEGELLTQRGEGAGGVFWDQFMRVLKGTSGDVVMDATHLVRAISKNNPDFIEGMAKIQEKYGRGSHRILKELIRAFGDSFDDVIAEASKISKLPNAGGDDAFLAGMTAFAQAVGKKQSISFAAKSDAVRNANPWAAAFVRNLTANKASTTLSNLEDVLDEVNEGIILLTKNNGNASTNLKKVQSWLKTVGNFNPGPNPNPHLNLLGYVQEMKIVARKAISGAQIQIKHAIGVLDSVFTELGKRVGYESQLLGSGANISVSTMKPLC